MGVYNPSVSMVTLYLWLRRTAQKYYGGKV